MLEWATIIGTWPMICRSVSTLSVIVKLVLKLVLMLVLKLVSLSVIVKLMAGWMPILATVPASCKQLLYLYHCLDCTASSCQPMQLSYARTWWIQWLLKQDMSGTDLFAFKQIASSCAEVPAAMYLRRLKSKLRCDAAVELDRGPMLGSAKTWLCKTPMVHSCLCLRG